MTAPNRLKLVPNEPVETQEFILRTQFAAREEVVAKLKFVDEVIACGGRRLAKERGVAFIRFEHLKREFGQ